MNAHEAETLTKIAALRDSAAVLDAEAQTLTAEATRHLATTRRVNLGAYVNQDLAERLGELAQRNERSKSAELRLALRAWLDQHPPQQEISPIANATTATH